MRRKLQTETIRHQSCTQSSKEEKASTRVDSPELPLNPFFLYGPLFNPFVLGALSLIMHVEELPDLMQLEQGVSPVHFLRVCEGREKQRRTRRGTEEVQRREFCSMRAAKKDVGTRESEEGGGVGIEEGRGRNGPSDSLCTRSVLNHNVGVRKRNERKGGKERRR